MHTYSLTGTITNQDKLPLPNITVIAYDQDPNTPETQLGEAVLTSIQGQYSITFTKDDFIKGKEHGGADIVLRVYTPDGQVLLGESKRYGNSPKEAVIDLQIDYDPEPKVAPPSITIKGNVQDRLLRSLKGAVVELWDETSHHQIASAAPTDRSGDFEIVLQEDAFELATQCTLFYFQVVYQKKVVFHSYESGDEKPITWDISHKKEDRIELIANITGQVTDQLYPKNIALLLNQHAHKTIHAVQKENQKVATIVNEMISEDVKQLITSALGTDIDPVVLKILNKWDLTSCADQKIAIRDSIETHLRKNKVTQQQFDKVQRKIEDAGLPPTIHDLFPLDKTLKEIPLFQKVLNEGQTHALASIAKLPAKKCKELLQKGWRIDDSDFRLLEALQSDGSLTKKQTAGLRQLLELNALFDGQLSLIKTLKTKPISSTGHPLKELKELVPLRAKDWEEIVIAQKDSTIPKELSADSYARLLEKRVEKAFPTATLIDRFEPADPDVLREDFDRLSAVLQQNPHLLKTRAWDALDLEGMTIDEVKKLKQGYDRTLQQLNRYHGLDVHRMSNKEIDIDKHLVSVTEKIKLLDTFYQNNAEKELLTFDLGPESDPEAQGIDFTGIRLQERKLILRHVKTDQRLYNLTNDIRQALLFKKHGFYNSAQIQEISLPSFAKKLGVDATSMIVPYQKSQSRDVQIKEQLQNWWKYKYDELGDIALGGGNRQVKDKEGNLVNFEDEVLRKYDGYQDFFGSLDYCDCKHCNSIFSPAAYFVDLMAWIEKMVLNDVFDTEELAKHPLHLQNRRPDLYYLDLSCINTHDSLPYLDIINEVMENYIFYTILKKDPTETEFYQKTSFQTIVQLSKNRKQIATKIYEEAIYSVSADAIYSIKAPVHLPLEEIKVYLAHFSISLDEIALAMNVEDQETITRARLGISKRFLYLIAKEGIFSDIDRVAAMRRLMGTDIQDAAGNKIPVAVKSVLKALDIKRSELTELLQTSFIASRGNPFIKSSKRDETDVQNNQELVYNLGISNGIAYVLDRMHRFVRLWRLLPYTIDELDLMIHQIDPDSDEITMDTLHKIGFITKMRTRFDRPLDQICLLFQSFPKKSFYNPFFSSLFNNLFNSKPFEDKESYPYAEDIKFKHPVFEDTTELSKKELPRLLAGLGVTDAQLFLLLNEDSPLSKGLISETFGVTIQFNAQSFQLSLQNLSLLYRHARLAEFLEVSIPELFQLLQLVDEIEDNFIDHGEISHLEKLIEYFDWWKTTPYSLDALTFLKTSPENTRANPVITNLTGAFFNQLHKDNPFVFTDTVLAYLPGVTEEQSKQIILNNINHQINDTFYTINGEPTELSKAYQFTIPKNIEIKDVKINADNEEIPLSTDEVRSKLSVFFQTNDVRSENINSDFFYKKKTSIGLEQTITEQLSSRLFFLNLDLFQRNVNPGDLIRQSPSKTYQIKDGVDLDSYTDLKKYTNPGAPAITKALLSELGFAENEIEEIIFTILVEITNDHEYVLNANPENNLLKVPAHIPITSEQINTAFRSYEISHILCFYLGQQLGISTEKVKALSRISDIDLAEAVYTKEALTPDQDAVKIRAWIAKIHRLSILFTSKEFTDTSLIELQNILKPLSLTSNTSLQYQIEQVNSLRPFIKETSLTELKNILEKGFNKGEQQFKDQMSSSGEVTYAVYPDLSKITGASLTPIKLVNEEGQLGHNAIIALERLQKRIGLSDYLGVGGGIIQQVLSDDPEDLITARDAFLSAFRLKYTNEKEWNEIIEPFQDRIRTLKRDILTDYLIHGLDKIETGGVEVQRFPNTREIYKHFLIDTELEGCARTSRVVAAISSIQVFIQRILLNLEVSDDFTLKIEPEGEFTQKQFKAQWEWRKNYRVWEANRKVFLYPENYIEPELRDNKTELFKELEEELLQREISTETVEEAYKKYMQGFEEVNNLQVAGAYHEKELKYDLHTVQSFDLLGQPITNYMYDINPNPERSIDNIHLFAVTPGDENQLYYRKIENTYLNGLEGVNIKWNSWEKVNLKIPTKKVSPIVYNGKLYVFWYEIKTKPFIWNFKSKNILIGYSHQITTKYSSIYSSLNRTLNYSEELITTNNELFQILNAEIKVRNTFSFKEHFNELINKLIERANISITRYGWKNEENQKIELITNGFDLLSQYLEGYLERKNDSKFITIYNVNFNRKTKENGTLGPFKVVESKRIDFECSLDLLKDKYVLKFDDSKLEHVQEIENYFPNFSFWGRPVIENSKYGLVLNLHRKNLIDLPSNKIRYFKNIGEFSTFKCWLNKYPLDRNVLQQRYDLIDTNYVETNKYSLATYAINYGQFPLVDFSKKIASITLTEKADAHVINSTEEFNIILQLKDSVNFVGTSARSKIIQVQLQPRIKKLINNLNIYEDFQIVGIKNFIQLKYQNSLVVKIKKFSLNGNSGYEESFIYPRNLNDKNFSNKIYFWELFFHIPFLIANHLNSQQKFVEAQQWYHYIFNPNAKPSDQNDGKYIWQFRGFYDQEYKETLRDILTNSSSIRTYEKDPFNPHAIARTRATTYQKTIVMKYIDNLLDWGDHLFAQDTMESVNEANMLYILAYEILGERPVSVGDCGEKKDILTYQQIKQGFSFNNPENFGTTPILIEELESSYGTPQLISTNLLDDVRPRFIGFHNFSVAQIEKYNPNKSSLKNSEPYQPDLDKFTTFHFTKNPVFCIPKNKDLHTYWDRVENRLFKIRNCMNLKGVKRELALFSPEIDPRLLVRAKAEGLSIQQVLETLSGNLPPYRFPYLIAKAKEYVGLVQGFGSALQGALERKDVEYMSQLQTAHQKNIQNMSRYIRDRELETVESSLVTLFKRREAAKNRKNYYDDLIDRGTTKHEKIGQDLRHSANLMMTSTVSTFAIAGGIHLVPKILGMSNSTGADGSAKFAETLGNIIRFTQDNLYKISDSLSIAANNERRTQNWKFQRNSAKDELSVIEEQIKGAEIRKAIAERNYQIFEQSIEQQQEIFDFIENKFSNLGLYTWLSSQLSRLYRETWNNAHTMAKMAERAYRFERSDDTSPLLTGKYWDSSHHGLLAGQQLLMDLQNLERRYIETHHRRLEVDQSFSLMQIDPRALLELKQKGVCDFSVPELFFDLSYPGQYKRRIRSARLTIPCIVGPYVNVGATLTLTGSRIRVEPTSNSKLNEMPPTRTATIATSTAQNDSGVFEFSFRDERYMPFEGAGAISDWNIKLPDSFRPFDYNTINDVILHISYEADYDSVWAEKVEKGNAELQNSIEHTLKQEGLSRMFSLRQEFSDVYHQLVYQKQEVQAKIQNKHFPFFTQRFLNEMIDPSMEIIIITKDNKLKEEAKKLITAEHSNNTDDNGVLFDVLLRPNFETQDMEENDIKDVLVYVTYKLKVNHDL